MIIKVLICLKVSLYMILLSIHIIGAYSSFEKDGVKCRKTEMLALLQFKAKLIDDFGQLSTWGHEEKDCCKWEGVLCHNRTNQVVALDLHGLGLRGKVSSSLLELANLNYLDLGFNDFNESQIPEFVGFLGKLQHLNLNFSNFGGLIPRSLGNLSNLRFLDLSGNWILDTNLDWLSGLQSLEYLDLSTANLHKATTWPQAINKMAALKEIHLQSCELSTNMLNSLPLANASNSLVVLDLPGNALRDILILLRFLNTSSRWRHVDLSFNILQGEIPNAFGNLMSLSYLDLSRNHLVGRIPDALGSVTSLSHLDLSNNDLSGEFPYALGNLTRLSHLDLSNNQLQGEFPRPSSQLKESRIEGNLKLLDLEVLDLSMNKFSGRAPDLSACSSLRWLSLYDNMFNGTLAESIGYLSDIKHLDLGSNHLEGLISEAHLLNLSKLLVLDWSFNTNLTVRIGSFWDPPFQLSRLMLAHCKLGPYFPKWLQNQKQVEFVDISSAEISDTIPHWFWDNVQMCEHLNMSHNQIYGVLPDLSSKLNLLTIDLSFNEFNGSLPLLPQNMNNIYLSGNKFSGTIINFFNFKRLFALDLSNNLFSVEISQDCFMKLMRLFYLNLANNNFFGEIPNSIGFCSLYSLHLENNSFTGYLSRLLKNCSNLIILDLGGNKFTGKIPSWLGDSIPELGVLSLKSNKLYGVLPSSL
ncbi:Leucine-rich repeat protein [Handroanthus impetiginosus]|uniref:Leucine-rich repeat protein n=1 Tax=Handroanthus impetiginosus TaxID=429701 RepID=A0A2G9HR22_9LAMI|nr:Leucine-rich repeat protein [Handroanthus impetiginosus]